MGVNIIYTVRSLNNAGVWGLLARVIGNRVKVLRLNTKAQAFDGTCRING